jgi:hypothetical protein
VGVSVRSGGGEGKDLCGGRREGRGGEGGTCAVSLPHRPPSELRLVYCRCTSWPPGHPARRVPVLSAPGSGQVRGTEAAAGKGGTARQRHRRCVQGAHGYQGTGAGKEAAR